MIWVEQPFKKEQLVEVFKLSKLKQYKKSYEFDVNDTAQNNPTALRTEARLVIDVLVLQTSYC